MIEMLPACAWGIVHMTQEGVFMNGEKISIDGARGSDAIPETPGGLNGPTGAVPVVTWAPPWYYELAGKQASCITNLESRIATLEAENAELRRLIAFGDPTPGDHPDPPRRPDGTLAPAPKPWTPPKEQGPSRRVGA